jgi:hypothetical protein
VALREREVAAIDERGAAHWERRRMLDLGVHGSESKLARPEGALAAAVRIAPGTRLTAKA